MLGHNDYSWTSDEKLTEAGLNRDEPWDPQHLTDFQRVWIAEAIMRAAVEHLVRSALTVRSTESE